jgi:ribosomal protein S18 acetylase RimI-like enzyme
MTDDFKIRIATAEDYLTIADIGRRTFYESWRVMNTEEDMQLYIAEAFAPEKIRKDLSSSYNTFFLAYLKEELTGYAKLRTDRMPQTGDEFNGSPAMEMERIYVKKEYQGMKAGKALMDASIELAKAGKYEWLWLGVNKGNHKAINFYKQYGFTIFGSKFFKLGKAEDEDYLMKMRLN